MYGTTKKKEYGFDYADYTPSESVTKAQTALAQQQTAKPGAYQSQWDRQLQDTMDQIANRKEFKYDLNGDALYQQYRQQAIKNGRLAMMDTMGQAAAMTGGYGNSYAQQVGQQTYQQHMTDLNDKVPQLYQLALQRYDLESQNLKDRYSMLSDREGLDYSRYRDQVGDWQNERNYLAGRFDTERGLDLDRYYNDRSFGQDVWEDAQKRALAQVQWYLDNGREPPADLVELADLDSRYISDLLASKNKKVYSGGTQKPETVPNYTPGYDGQDEAMSDALAFAKAGYSKDQIAKKLRERGADASSANVMASSAIRKLGG